MGGVLVDDGPGPVRADPSVVRCDECGEPATFGVWVNAQKQRFRFCRPCTTVWIMEKMQFDSEEVDEDE